MQDATTNVAQLAARREALAWLARQLRWERTLDEMRSTAVGGAQEAA